MEAEFRQDLLKRTMVVKRGNPVKSSFREKMAIKNRIRGTAMVSIRYMNGESYYSYDMGSCQTVKNYFDGNPMSFKEMKSLLSGLRAVSSELEKYLLDIKDLLMEPEHIFWDTDKEEPLFCYYPEKAADEEGFSSFGQFLMDAADKEDEKATEAAYAYFDRICEGVLLPGELPSSEGSSNGKPTEEEVKRELPISAVPIGEEEDYTLKETQSENRDNYYMEDSIPEEQEEKQSRKGFLLILAFFPALFSAAAYGIVFMRPEIMGFLGLSDEDYIRVGVGVIVLSGAFITAGIYMWNKRRKEKADRENDRPGMAGYSPGV